MSGKRSNGEGYVKQLDSGKWRGQLMDGYTDEGKKRVVSLTGDTKTDVLRQLRDYQTKKEANIHIDRNMTFSEWSEKWYIDYKDQVQPSTYCGYKFTLKILNKALGVKIISEILPMNINGMLSELRRQEYSMSQIRKCRAMLIQIFDSAEDNGLIARNPARRAKIMKNNGEDLSPFTSDKKDAFTSKEIIILFEKLPCDLMGESIRLLLKTGLRVQELIALTQNDIAEDGSTIIVNKAIKTINGVSAMGCTKSKRGNRVVPVPPDSRCHAVNVRLLGGNSLIWTGHGPDLLYGVGAFRRRYYNVLKAIPEVRKLSPHCCRHTYITMLQAKGVPMETIARLAGHSDIETTDGYLHTSAETLSQAANMLEGVDKAGYVETQI